MAPRAIQKLVRYGNGVGVNIPRAILHLVGWLPGSNVIIELVDNDKILIRLPKVEDFGTQVTPRMLFEQEKATVAK